MALRGTQTMHLHSNCILYEMKTRNLIGSAPYYSTSPPPNLGGGRPFFLFEKSSEFANLLFHFSILRFDIIRQCIFDSNSRGIFIGNLLFVMAFWLVKNKRNSKQTQFQRLYYDFCSKFDGIEIEMHTIYIHLCKSHKISSQQIQNKKWFLLLFTHFSIKLGEQQELNVCSY